MERISLQEYADKIVDPQYRQPLKTLAEAVAANGWEYVDHPICCGEAVSIRDFLGSPYFAECKKCGRFLVDISGPTFGNSWINLPDNNKIVLDIDERWIAGQQGQTAGTPRIVEG